jgi:hypothetical protein
VTTENPKPAAPSKCIVHGKYCGAQRQIGDEYHMHWMSPICGRHFDHIEIQGFGGIPPERVSQVLDRLITRLRNPDAGIVIKWGGL